jgi:hypothetical protein
VEASVAAVGSNRSMHTLSPAGDSPDDRDRAGTTLTMHHARGSYGVVVTGTGSRKTEEANVATARVCAYLRIGRV